MQPLFRVVLLLARPDAVGPSNLDGPTPAPDVSGPAPVRLKCKHRFIWDVSDLHDPDTAYSF